MGALPLRFKIAIALALVATGGWLAGPLPALASTVLACVAYEMLVATIVRPLEELHCSLRRGKPGEARYPDEVGALADYINRALVANYREGVASQTGAPEPSGGLKVLLAEDNEINQMIAVNLLEKLGHNVTAVADGTEVLAALLTDSYDLLIVDIQMPRLDGFGVAAALRAHPRRAGMPMIALTSNTSLADRERCLAAGMDGYVPKPVARAELVAEIERVLAVQPAARAA